MTDYQHIPLHIRCTERWKIDPEYPEDSCKWWLGQAQILRGDGERRPCETRAKRRYEEMTPAEVAKDPYLQEAV